MQLMTSQEVEQVSGGGVFATIAFGMGTAAAIAGGLAAVPTPASPALAGFAVLTGVMAAGAGYLDTLK